MATWPVSLPQAPLANSFRRVSQDSLVRFSPDVGPDVRRRRTTARSMIDSFALVLTQAQLDDLDDFYDSDLEDGALSFDFPDPVSGATKSFAFAAPYEVEHVSEMSAGPVYRVSVTLVRAAE